ncbi:aldose 1-epimerase family protein [Gluconobacter kondonii]|uniref:aldose 1-epimerase family protein n=1 Tax=Gluconobacter kondonii TaxID=941463 RepID=UPI001B8CDFA0|nr:aldose 1-epimerase family protein [Gluconobacter kondonii]MBS1083103.1 aldose 1-epimerase family protein [Gluconobacter kondonii]
MTDIVTDDRHDFGTGLLKASVRSHGAELVALHNGTDNLLWNAGPAWPRQSPVLFPIIGRLPDHEITLDGAPVKLKQHGLARDRVFRWIARTPEGCTLELVDDAESHALFPSAFRLRLVYLIENNTLRVSYHLHNPDSTSTLHASLGAHPAFRWPLKQGVAKDSYRLVFEYDEPLPVRRIDADGLLLPEKQHTPVRDNVLALTDALFEKDALILEKPESRSVDMVGPDGAGIRFVWGGFKELGLWTKPGADFLCIEPWYGYATPVGFKGDFSKKPGLLHLKPGESWTAFWSVKAI